MPPLETYWFANLPIWDEHRFASEESMLTQARTKRRSNERRAVTTVNDETRTDTPYCLVCADCGKAAGDPGREGPVTVRDLHGRLICSDCKDALSFALD